MTFRTETIIKSGRTSHICDYCGGTIPAGSRSQKIAGRWDGDFYSARGHLDCNALWNEVYHIYADDYEGMQFDLMEAMDADEDREIKQATYDLYRGRYPHVICRLELRWQRGDISTADRYRSLGLEPEPEDCPEVYG